MDADPEQNRIRLHREFYATLLLAGAGIPESAKIHSALASTPREAFLGKGPWKMLTPGGYRETPSDDVTFVYRDMPVALEPELSINNGQPLLHVICFAALAIKQGETLVHIGAGTGYYTAIMAELTGPEGSVYAVEIKASLAERARQNLASMPQVTVMERSGSEGQLPSADVVYVNAGATAPLSIWLDALRPGGRLSFPLTPAQGGGAMLLICRKAVDTFDARFLSPAMFIGCVGAREEEAATRLTEAFARGDSKLVRSLHRDSAPDQSCWFAGSGWWLSTRPNPDRLTP